MAWDSFDQERPPTPFDDVRREVLAQRKVLLNDLREPAEIWAHVEYKRAFLQEEHYWAPWTYGREQHMPEGVDGYLFGLPVRFDFEPGIRVLPKDWRGPGTGSTRPGVAGGV